ncbi:hypothetical protein SVIOM342S_05493 [Streptomyces violaceorubidus]
MSTHTAPTLGTLASRLTELSLRDAHRLGRRLEGARKIRKPEARAAVLAEIETEVAKAEQRIGERRARVPAVSYPEQLPVSQKKDEIAAAIRDHQVVIVAGETGSGKTTQIPKICVELGRGVRGMIGHTQPRRIAARTVAERVADELDTPLGETVGWKVRFTDQVNPQSTFIKLMTDGILLAEIQTDRELRAYDTIIIDEAHERSLNIDFLLGYLSQLLPKRPDLKVVITSATIDPERFSRHFGDAPVIEVSGRTYPVEVRYRPLLEEEGDDADRDQITAITDAVEELMGEGKGDILVFLSGEREIRDTADALEKKRYKFTEVLPLYARLSHAEQHRVFQQHTGRRIVLATNVAETSLTVPGIKYVIDPGFARISRYSHRTKVQRLPIEPISQASANQRKGRCGRTSDGICIRLYSEDDFEARPEFTDAEILRTNLASVILQMTAAGLGDIEKFPFIDPPDHRNIRDGVQLLQELGALDPAQKDVRKRLTDTGRKLAQLPVDPRLARMVLEADKNGCVREVMVIAAALSIQDPRERPAEKQAQADQQHARFKDESSDFLAFLNLWRYVREQQKERGSSSFRRMCKQEYLNFLRIREWQDIYTQLRTVAKQMGIHLNDNTVSVRLFDTEAEQAQAMWKGTRRLILRNIPVNPAKFASEKLTNQQKLGLSANPHGSIQALFDDCAMAAADKLIADFGGPAWDEESYRKLYDKVRAEIVDTTVRTVGQVQQVLAAWQACERRLKAVRSPALLANLQDVRGQLDALVKPGFVTEAGIKRLPDLMRYLVAADRRLQQMPTGVQRDTSRMEKVHEMRDEYAWLLEQMPQGRPVPQQVLDIRWMIEELRVSYFAHALGTAYPVSDKRIVKAIDALAP